MKSGNHRFFSGLSGRSVAAMILVGAFAVNAAASEGVKPIKEIWEPAGNFDPKVYGKVAVIQWNNTTPTPIDVSRKEAEEFKQGNREVLADQIREAADNGAKMVITPEFAIVGYPNIPELPEEEDNFQSPEQLAPYTESARGATFRYFSALAKELKIYLHVGFAEAEGNRYYNTVIAIDPTGKLVATYRKIHLFKLEENFLHEGTRPVVYQSREFGKVGIVICSDVYSSHPMDEYAGAIDVLALSTSWAQFNSGWSHFVSGAKWVKAPVLAANQNYFPDSGVVNADGSTQSHIRQSAGIAYGYLKYKSRK